MGIMRAWWLPRNRASSLFTISHFVPRIWSLGENHEILKGNDNLKLRSEDFPGVSAGDVLELYHEEEVGPRLLLQVKLLLQ